MDKFDPSEWESDPNAYGGEPDLDDESFEVDYYEDMSGEDFPGADDISRLVEYEESQNAVPLGASPPPEDPPLKPVTPPPGASWRVFEATSSPFQSLKELFDLRTPRFLYNVSKKASEEDWGEAFWALRSYLEHTWRRVLDEKKVFAWDVAPKEAKTDEEAVVRFPSRFLFNTGLQTNEYKDIFLILHLVEVSTDTPRKYAVDPTHAVVTADSLSNKNFMISFYSVEPIPPKSVPIRAKYLSGESALNAFLDADLLEKLDLNAINFDHMFTSDKLKRWPEKYQRLSSEEIKNRFLRAFPVTINRAKANPRIGVPQFFRDKNAEKPELQLLLPLSLDETNVYMPDVAVALRTETATDPHTGLETSYYEVRTFLDLQVAYSNARLISRVDQDWLLPESTRGGSTLGRGRHQVGGRGRGRGRGMDNTMGYMPGRSYPTLFTPHHGGFEPSSVPPYAMNPSMNMNMNGPDMRHPREKTVWCRFFKNGFCKNGEQCTFRHY